MGITIDNLEHSLRCHRIIRFTYVLQGSLVLSICLGGLGYTRRFERDEDVIAVEFEFADARLNIVECAGWLITWSKQDWAEHPGLADLLHTCLWLS